MDTNNTKKEPSLFNKITDLVKSATRHDADDIELIKETTESTTVEAESLSKISFKIETNQFAGQLPKDVLSLSPDKLTESLTALKNANIQNVESLSSDWVKENKIKYFSVPKPENFTSISKRYGFKEHCTTCKGHGQVGCSACGRDGVVVCHACSGKGSTTCSTCRGTNSVTCFACSGQGVTGTGTSNVYRCNRCTGSGRISCSACLNGRVNCYTCNLQGKLTCRSCSGNGYINCTTCQATGLISTIGTVKCNVETESKLVASTLDIDAKGTIESKIGYQNALNFSSMKLVHANSNNASIIRQYKGLLNVTTSELTFKGKDFKIKGYGNQLEVYEYSGIVNELLAEDLIQLKSSIISTSIFGVKSVLPLISTLKEFLESEVNLDIAVSESKKAMDISNSLAGIVTVKYVDDTLTCFKKSMVAITKTQSFTPGLLITFFSICIFLILLWFFNQSILISFVVSATICACSWFYNEFRIKKLVTSKLYLPIEFYHLENDKSKSAALKSNDELNQQTASVEDNQTINRDKAQKLNLYITFGRLEEARITFLFLSFFSLIFTVAGIDMLNQSKSKNANKDALYLNNQIESQNEQAHLKEINGWGLSINFNKQNDIIQNGKFEFKHLNCGGDLTVESAKSSDNKIVLNENVLYGNCTSNCKILLKKDMKTYSETCGGKRTAMGSFEVNESQQSLAKLMKNNNIFQVLK